MIEEIRLSVNIIQRYCDPDLEDTIQNNMNILEKTVIENRPSSANEASLGELQQRTVLVQTNLIGQYVMYGWNVIVVIIF